MFRIDYQVLVDQYKALADSNRLQILEILKHGEQCACVLLEHLDLTQSGLSYHMKILTQAGLVLARPEGKWTYYQLSNIGCDSLMNSFAQLTQLEAGQLPNHFCSKEKCE